ncbi:Deleted in malignant brain tumors 1 protein-like [Mactra antiquata]
MVKIVKTRYSWCSETYFHMMELRYGSHNGNGIISGTIFLYHNGQYGTICDDEFGEQEAKVICRMLGYHGQATAFDGAHFGQGSGKVWLDDLGCSGYETDIAHCSSKGWGIHNCGHAEDAGVTCHGYVTNLRLVGGRGNYEDHSTVRLVEGSLPSEGRVEVLHNGIWGTVCGNSFTQNDADVICRMLGFNETAVSIVHNVSSGVGPIWLGDLDCFGDEADIEFCNLGGWNNHSCTHANDVGIRCEPTHVRLVNGQIPSEGRVEISANGRWYSICEDGFGDTEADVVCRMLGYTGRNAPHIIYHADEFGRTSNISIDKLTCTGDETDISHCVTVYHTSCPTSKTVGLRCEGVQVRLVDGAHSTEGRVEVFHNRQWGSICDVGFDDNDATAVCKMLTYFPYETNADPFLTNNFTSLNHVDGLDVKPQCKGTEGNFEMCKTDTTNITCSYTQNVNVDCNLQNADSSNVRLVDGPGPWSGRLELKSNGVWGSVCYKSWNASLATTVCETLRFLYTNATSYKTSRGLSPMHYDYLSCDGVNNIGHCAVDYNITECSIQDSGAVGIDCSGGLSVTLGNNGTFGGEVKLHTSNSSTPWSVCRNGINTTVAFTICAMAGFPHPSVSLTSTSSQYPPLYNAIACDGWETHISQCSVMYNGQQCDEKAYIHCFPGCINVINVTTASPSGFVSSLGYPGNNSTYTDCLTIIHNNLNKPLKLVFNDLDLDKNGDFLEVKDGPGGRQLGYYTTNKTPILVSDKDFYIRRKSNHVPYTRGFNASYSILRVEDAVSMECSPSGWNVAVNMTILRHLYPDTGVSYIKLSNQKCTGRVFGDLVIFDQHYTECSTSHTVDLQCNVPRTDTVTSNFHPGGSRPNQVTTNPHLSSSTHYSSELSFYKDPTYFQRLQGNPISLQTGQNVYVQVKMTSDDVNIKMRLDSCYTKPDPNSGPSMTYHLVQNGCVVDPGTTITSQGNHETRFVFQTFEFSQARNSVYVYCNATYCDVHDVTDRCTQVCHGTPTLVGRDLILIDRDIN